VFERVREGVRRRYRRSGGEKSPRPSLAPRARRGERRVAAGDRGARVPGGSTGSRPRASGARRVEVPATMRVGGARRGYDRSARVLASVARGGPRLVSGVVSETRFPPRGRRRTSGEGGFMMMLHAFATESLADLSRFRRAARLGWCARICERAAQGGGLVRRVRSKEGRERERTRRGGNARAARARGASSGRGVPISDPARPWARAGRRSRTCPPRARARELRPREACVRRGRNLRLLLEGENLNHRRADSRRAFARGRPARSPLTSRASHACKGTRATMSALKTIQDKLAIEANDFQALQKGTPGLSSRDPSRRSTREPRADLFPHPSSQI
jgi:hypothetical protein